MQTISGDLRYTLEDLEQDVVLEAGLCSRAICFFAGQRAGIFRPNRQRTALCQNCCVRRA